MTGGEYFKSHLVYLGKRSESLQHHLLWHADLPDSGAVNSTNLDIAAGCALAEMFKWRSYPGVLKSLRRKVGKHGFALIGKVLGEGTIDAGNYIDVWAPDKPSMPPGVHAEPLDMLSISSPLRETDGVYGGRSRILPGDQPVTETLMTLGYRYHKGQFDISSSSPFHKHYQA